MKLGGEILGHLFQGCTWRAYRGDELMPWSLIEPLIGPNSIDVTLSDTFLIPDTQTLGPVDPRDETSLHWETVKIPKGEAIILHPGAFMLGAVQERFVCEAEVCVSGGEAEVDVMNLRFGGGPQSGNGVSRKALFAPMYEGRSSCGRLGLASHITAGFGDYGFGGAFTLELYNHMPRPLMLYPGMRIGQVAFEEVYEPKRYAGAYSGSNHHQGPVPPKLGPDRF